MVRGRPTKAVVAKGFDPEAPRPANTAADRDFIEANLDQFLHKDGSLVWSGRSEDIGHPFQLPPPHLRCLAERQLRDDEGGLILDVDLNPLRRRCPMWAMAGADRCVDHAKGSKSVMDEVRKRIAADANAYYGQLREIAMNPHAEDADRIRALNSMLDRGGLKAGVEISADTDSWAELYKKIAGGDGDGGDG
jgi:hypothetical protein